MDTSIDWPAFARLAAVPLIVATLLGVGLWWRQSLRARSPLAQLAALTALTLFLSFDLVAFGAYTRLTDSGLGCPDWPGCYAQATPVGAATPIATEEASRPTGPVTERKAWIEMLHRYFAGSVGLLVIGMVMLAARARAQRRRALAWSIFTLAWIIGQGIFGALTVTMKLYPAIVTGHLLGGLGLVALLAWQRAAYRRTDDEEAREAGRPSAATNRASDRRWLGLASVVLLVQVMLGGWVSTNYAVLACQDFPTCHGRWWPEMDWAGGFSVFRHLGRTASGELLGFPALVAIHWAHRLFAVVAVVVLVAAARRFRHRPAARRAAIVLGVLLVAQVATGLSNVVLGWPLVAALAHTAGAAALVITLCTLAAHLRDRDRPGVPGRLSQPPGREPVLDLPPERLRSSP